MSLSFLSKKSWHTLNTNNVEKVWLAEQAEAEEKRKLEEWKHQRQEERQKEDLHELQQETGHACVQAGPARCARDTASPRPRDGHARAHPRRHPTALLLFAAGRKREPQRVNFLYEQPMTTASEHLLGKPVEIKPEDSDIKRVEHLPGSNFLSGQVWRTPCTNRGSV